LKLIYK